MSSSNEFISSCTLVSMISWVDAFSVYDPMSANRDYWDAPRPYADQLVIISIDDATHA